MATNLESLGWDTHRVPVSPDLEPGRIVRADRGISTVLTRHGEIRASLGGAAMAAAAADPVDLPCAGDWVLVRRWPDQRITMEKILPRQTAIIRRTSDKDSAGQILASNITTAAVVASLDPMPEPATIERLLALAWDSGAPPILVLTKSDLVRDPSALASQLEDLAPGVPVYPVSAEHDEGLDPLRVLCGPSKTLGLIGASGAGKSTLANALLGSNLLGTQQVRRVDGKGRHTTTFRALVPVPGGGAVLDTPGIRSVGLLDGEQGLDRAFNDVRLLASQCKFPDCTHAGEPGCAIAAALATGELAHRRWASWLKLLRELEFEQKRYQNRVATARKKDWRSARHRPGRS